MFPEYLLLGWKFYANFLASMFSILQKKLYVQICPPQFKTPRYSSVRHIIDCSEVFIEMPQSMTVSNQCWSDYKHKFTAKFLVSITPAGMINSVSNCRGGRASDKCITINSGFFHLIESHDSVMADKGFCRRWLFIMQTCLFHQVNMA